MKTSTVGFKSVMALLVCLTFTGACVRSTAATPLGLYQGSTPGTLMYQGKLFRGIGVNYFDAFYRNNTTYQTGFAYLQSQNIPFIRVMLSPGYWPNDFSEYLTNRQAYFQRMDAFVHDAETYHIGLIASLFFNPMTISDVVGEPQDQWGNPNSKTIAFMKTYIQEMVNRYYNSPAIWGWEFGNELNKSDCDLLDQAINYLPPVNVAEGTPASRTAADEMTTAIINVAYTQFAQTVRLYDPTRIVLTGNDIVGNNQYNRAELGMWNTDTAQQFNAIMAIQEPSPIDTTTMHLYPGDLGSSGMYFNGANTTATDLVNEAMDVANYENQPLVVEEFGASDTDANTQTEFTDLLNTIVTSQVPLSAMWVYDYSGQNGTYNVTQSNSRAYQLADVVSAEAQIRAQLGL